MPDSSSFSPLPTPHRTALIVDDDEFVRKFLRYFMMQYFAHYHIEEAQDGYEAEAKIKQLRPELILLDLRIPGPDGVGLCREIRNFPGLSETILIVISGINDELIYNTVLLFGANAVITKPFKGEELRQKIVNEIAKKKK